MGIVGGGIALVVVPVLYLYMRMLRRRARLLQGSMVMPGDRESAFNLSSPTLRATPFNLHAPSADSPNSATTSSTGGYPPWMRQKGSPGMCPLVQ